MTKKNSPRVASPFILLALAGGLGLDCSAQSQPETELFRVVSGPVQSLPVEARSAVAVTVNPTVFEGDSMVIPLATGDALIASVDRTRHHSAQSTGKSGTLEGIPGGWFSIVRHGEAFHAIIGADHLGKYELRATGQRTDAGERIYHLIEIDESKFLGCATNAIQIPQNRADSKQGVTGASPSSEPSGAIAQGSANQNTGGPASIVDDGSVVDIMIVYTAQARSGWGGTNAIMALAQNSVDVSNIAYANSQISPFELRLVHAQEISYSESGDASTDIFALQDPSDGVMDDVHPLRDTHGADLVALLVNSFNACGVAFLSPFNSDFGFSVTDTGCAVANLTFPHEVGHNMGAHHDRNNAGSAPYPYAYGWRWTSTNGTRYRSVMAYSQSSDTRVPHFSNPSVNYIGTPTGVANSEDNARVHRDTRTSVAKFRDSVDSQPCLPDTNGDGILSPADFSAWVAAFNAGAPACDQNSDGSCTPTDFSAWVANYNAGCP